MDRGTRIVLKHGMEEFAEVRDNAVDKPPVRNWCVYVLKCRNNALYIGITNNIGKRLREHGQGKGSKFVRSWRPFELVKTIPCKTPGEARSLEYRLKRLTRNKKIETLGLELGPIR